MLILLYLILQFYSLSFDVHSPNLFPPPHTPHIHTCTLHLDTHLGTHIKQAYIPICIHTCKQPKPHTYTPSPVGPKWVKVAQSCLTLCDPMDCSPARLLCPWDSPGKNTGVLPCPLPDTGMEPRSPALQADSLPGKPKVLCKWAPTLIHTHTHTHTETWMWQALWPQPKVAC